MRKILGIDPGTQVTGYGIIYNEGNKIILEETGTIKTSKHHEHFDKLSTIYHQIYQLITLYEPKEISIEAPFYGKNVQSMLKLGRAQGMAIAAGIHFNLPVFEYSARKIKQAITGNGNASKEQIYTFLQKIVHTSTSFPDEYDASDGIAAAVCHYLQKNTVSTGKKYNSWKEFMSKNPGRVR